MYYFQFPLCFMASTFIIAHLSKHRKPAYETLDNAVVVHLQGEMGQLILSLLLLLVVSGDCEGHQESVTSSLFAEKDEYSYTVDRELENDNSTCDFPWATKNKTGNCVCGTRIHESVYCIVNESDYSSSKVGILDCSCMTTDDSNEVVVGHCFYNCENGTTSAKTRINRVYHPINTPTHRTKIHNLTAAVCKDLNRDGRLCGKCEKGYYPPVYSYSYKCIKCPNRWYNWLKFIVEAFVPLTVFLILILVVRISATSVQLSAFVLYSQNFSIPSNVHVILAGAKVGNISGALAHTFVSLYSIWNLDFFRSVYPPICLHISTMQIILLEYTIAFYPMLLLLLVYFAVKFQMNRVRGIACLWAPMKTTMNTLRQTWNFKRSIIDAFATFFILSYSKFLSITFHTLMVSDLHNVNGTRVGRCVYTDCSLDYFGKDHWYYGLLALVIFIVFLVAPVVLMLVYPMKWFQRCLTRYNMNRELLRTFMDSFQGCFKDGTNGTRDCRYFGAAYLLLRIALFLTYAITLTSLFYAMATILFITMGILIITVRPYKQRYAVYNKVDAIMILIQALSTASILCNIFASIKGERFKTFSIILVAFFNILPLLYVTVIVTHWLYTRTTIQVCLAQLRVKLQGRHFGSSGTSEHEELTDHMSTSYGSIQ